MAGSQFTHFVRINSVVETAPFLLELDKAAQIWQADTSRQRKVKCQRNTWNIFLRAAKKPLPEGMKNANDVHECRTMRHSRQFPNTLAFCESFAQQQSGFLGRVTLVALLPKSKVYSHIDIGSYYAARDRYHLVLRSPQGSRLTAGAETVLMREGELWVFNNKVVHSAENVSDQIRVHLIFDIKPMNGSGYFVQSD